jgi:hypothetical protein
VKTKLTLTVDRDAVLRIKRLARQKGVSVSSLFELWSLKTTQSKTVEPLGSALRGQWKKRSAGKRAKDPRLDFLLDKHLK